MFGGTEAQRGQGLTGRAGAGSRPPEPQALGPTACHAKSLAYTVPPLHWGPVDPAEQGGLGDLASALSSLLSPFLNPPSHLPAEPSCSPRPLHPTRAVRAAVGSWRALQLTRGGSALGH